MDNPLIKMTLPTQIREWLNQRGLTDEVIASNNLGWNGSHIVIPILDSQGNFLFNKYRRDPFGPADIPKYKYEFGTTAQLFNAHKIFNAPFVVICEGESDAMRLEAEGIVGVTGTGGAGTFKNEWTALLTNKETYVCYDNDDAGMRGTIKLLTKLPAKLILIPRYQGVKDITDFLQAGHSFTSLMANAESYPILSAPVPEFKLIKDVEAQIKKYKDYLAQLLDKERNAKNSGQNPFHLDYIRQVLLIAINNLNRKIRIIRYANKPVNLESDAGRITNEDVKRAKEISIETLYAGELQKKYNIAIGLCPFHAENTASFTIYTNQNRWHCFGGCQQGGDSVDYVMRRDNCGFIEAVKKLVNKI